jgi:PPM family protein phosphatase
MKLAAGAFSDAGRVRDNNEDAHLVDDRLALFAIADGMGGHVGGEVASWTAIEALRAGVANGRAINDAIEQANDAVLERATQDPDLTGMGTTMTAVTVAGARRLLIGHVGDSRAYFLHDGALRQLTEDHSLVGEMMREGRLTPEQAQSHPQRAIVTRALGGDEDVQVDVYTLDVEAGDRLILCSDGLTDMVRERDIERIARDEPDPQRAAEKLVDAANVAGGVDNITVVVLDVTEVDDEAPLDPETLLADAEPAAVTPTPQTAPDVAPPVPAEPRASFGKRVRGALLLLIPLIIIIALAIGAVGWYARRSYFVGLDNESVVVFRGVPGGVFGWKPTVDQRSALTADELLPVDREAVQDGAARGSKTKAQEYVARLQRRVDSTTTTTTTTTRPLPPTTVARPLTPTTAARRPAVP